MVVVESKPRQAMDGERLGHQTASRGNIKVPSGKSGDCPPLEEYLKGFAVFGRWFQPFR